MKSLRALPFLLTLAGWPASTVLSADNPVRNIVAGPIDAEVVSVIDGDTILVSARPWPQHSIAVLVRIRGIDTPELKSKCARIRHAGQRARQRLEGLLASNVRLTNISGDKYFGRVVADVSANGTSDVATAMIASGLARSYDGGRKARESC